MGGRTIGLRGGSAIVVIALAVIIAGSWYLWVESANGFSASAQPTWIETWLAGLSRKLALPRGVQRVQNPYPPNEVDLAAGRTLFTARCEICHGVDGGGHTPLANNLYPKPPDLRSEETQSMSDGALYWTIRNGVRLSGMPAWPELSKKQIWLLVDVIRSWPQSEKGVGRATRVPSRGFRGRRGR